MKYHPLNDGLLACFGNLDCIIINLDPTKTAVLQTLKIDLMLDQLGDDLYIIDCCWLPNSQTHIAVLTPHFIKIYDLSKDTLSPAFCINQIEDNGGLNAMTSIAIARDTISQDFAQNNNLLRVFVGTASGVVYTLLLDIQENIPEHDSLYLVEDLQIFSNIQGLNNATTGAVVSLFWSSLIDVHCFEKIFTVLLKRLRYKNFTCRNNTKDILKI